MQYTPNYNLIIAEGTDAVNPLTQIFPNFTAIDTAMENNKEAGITTASEVTTGGVHAIVRVNSSVPVFRFTATSAWTTGDTMTLDGSAVTVHLADGTAPKSGAYVIGAEVLAIVNGSLVTLMTGASFDGVVSFNSRQGVVTPQSGDYTANQIGYNNTISGLVSTDVQAAIDELAALPPTLAWTELTSVTGTTTVNIPAGTNEVLMNVIYGSIAFVIHFIPSLPSQALRNGYYTSATNFANATFTWDGVTKDVHLTSATFANTDYTSTATTTIYIR